MKITRKEHLKEIKAELFKLIVLDSLVPPVKPSKEEFLKRITDEKYHSRQARELEILEVLVGCKDELLELGVCDAEDIDQYEGLYQLLGAQHEVANRIINGYEDAIQA